jgi:colanic acid/amylovoran biosynthesis glycosyltransferase
MKIAVIVSQFPLISETFVLSHITGLLDRGHDVDIIAWELGDLSVCHPEVKRYQLMSRLSLMTSPEGKLTRMTSALKLLLRNGHQWPVLRSLNVRRFGRRAGSLRLLHQVALFVRDYDVLHCHFGPNGEFVSQLKRLGVRGKLVTTFHGYDIRLADERGGQIYSNLFELCDALVAISPYNHRSLLRFGADPERLVMLPLGIEVHRQQVATPRQSPDAPLRLISVARLSPEKSVDSAVEAIARLKQLRPNVQLQYDIIGDGPTRPLIEARIAELGLRDQVRLLGAQDHGVVRDMLSQSHVFLLPSQAEALPICLMEASSAGLSIVATDVGSVDQIVIHGRTGFLGPVGDVDTMVAHLTTLVDNPETGAAFGHAGRGHILETFDHNRNIDALLDLYRQLLSPQKDWTPAARGALPVRNR